MKNNKVEEPTSKYGTHITYADYLEFTFEEMVEVIRGKIFRMTPAPSSFHQEISGKLYTLISNFIWKNKCKVYHAPFDVILPVQGKDFMESDRIVQPDICVICDPEKIKDRGCFGSPDWIIEILSPHTTKKDIQDKFDLYEESGVGEYWIVEPRNKTAEVFVMENTQYRRIRTYVEDDKVSSHTLKGLTIHLEEIFDRG